MSSPVLAIVWENWRLTRLEAAQRLALGIVAGSAALVLLGDAGATVAFWILIVLHGFFYFSIAKLNGGRFADGYKPGFPLYLLYTRPVSTATFVGVAMAYDALTCAALYVASVALLGFAFGQPLPLFSATVCLMAYHFAYICIQYATRSRVVQWIGATVITLPMIPLLKDRLAPPLQVELSLAENALMVLVGVVSFGLTVAGVARQRRGDARAAIPRTKGSGLTDWFAGLFRFPCPTSSPTRAQVWFDLKSSGLLVLAIGLALAILIPLLFAVTTQVDVVLSGLYARPYALAVAMFSLPAVLILGGNAFGIRSSQGRRYASVFEATQAFGSARIAVLKVLVRSVCLLAALVAVGTSVWTSASVIPFDVLEDNDTFIEKSRNPVSGWMRAIEGAVGAMSASELVALAFVTAMIVAVMVASRAALSALWARYRRRLTIAGSLLWLYGLALVLLGIGARRWNALTAVMEAVFWATPWLGAAATAFATAYLVWRSLAERLLSLRAVCAAVLISAAFGAACATLLRAAGVQLARTLTTDAAWMLSPVLLPLLVSVLAPWSLSRVRHT